MKANRRRIRACRFEELERRNLLATLDLASIDLTDDGAGVTAADAALNPAISANGRFVAFQSRATDLVTGVVDTNAATDIFIRDLELGTTVMISQAFGASRAAAGASFFPSLSDTGRYVAFVSLAADLVTAGIDDNSASNVFVHDRDTDKDGIFDEKGTTLTQLLGTSADGTAATALAGPFSVGRPVISGSGTYVAFDTTGSNIDFVDPTPADGPLTDFNGLFSDVARVGVIDRTQRLVSVNSALTGSGTFVFDSGARSPSINGDGSVVAFQSNHADLVDFDDNDLQDVFVGSGIAAPVMVSVNTTDADGGNGESKNAVVSGNGKHVAFISEASNLVATDKNDLADIFVRDLVNRRTTLVSRSATLPAVGSGNAASPTLPEGPFAFSEGPSISSSGRFIAYRSSASDLIDLASGVADVNGDPDIFVFDRDADTDGILDEPGGTATILVSVNGAGTASGAAPGLIGSFSPAISGDGRFVTFASTATDLIAGVTLAGTNVYVRDLLLGVTTLVSDSLAPGPTAGSDDSGFVTIGERTLAISGDGGRIAFVSEAGDLDSGASDTNAYADVYAYTPSPDILSVGAKTDGFTTLKLTYSVRFAPLDGPLAVGFYRSPDRAFGAGDVLLDTVTFTSVKDLAVGGHTFAFPIGGGAGEIALPGAGAAEVDEDYFLLIVADHLGVQEELDGDPFNEDNASAITGAYHLPSPPGPVFYQGRPSIGSGAPATFAGFPVDTITAATTATDFTLTTTPSGAPLVYPLASVTSLRARLHEGDDSATGSPLADFIWGGPGKDTLSGGDGDDLLDGGEGNDTIIGGAGNDILFDGMGDDIVDGGLGDDTVVSTPGSDDVFTDTGGSDTLHLSTGTGPLPDDVVGSGEIDMDSLSVQEVDAAGNTVQLIGQWESFVGSPFGSTLYARPLLVSRNLAGGSGPGDRLIFDGLGLAVTFDGTKFKIPGFGDVTVSGFEDIQTINVAPRIIDDSAPAPLFSAPGFFASDPNFPQGYNGGVQFSAADAGNTATWRFLDLAPGWYYVAKTWVRNFDRATSSPFTIRDGGPTGPIAASVIVNQEQNPGEFVADQGLLFRNLALVQVTGHELTVQLTDVGASQGSDDVNPPASEFVTADAVRLENVFFSTLFDTRFKKVIDDGDPGFTPGGFAPQVLTNPAANRGAFGDVHLGQDVGDKATHNFSGLTPGKYVVSATWTAGADQATNARFSAQSGGSAFNTTVNQQVAPDDFIDGGIPFEMVGIVEYSESGLTAGWEVTEPQVGVVVADAVRIDRAPEMQVFFIDPTPQAQVSFIVGVPYSGQLAENGELINGVKTMRFEIRNAGSDHLAIDNSNITVSNGAFSVSLPPQATRLPPGGSTQFEIKLTAGSTGVYSTGVSIPHNGFGNNPFIFNVVLNIPVDKTPPAVQIVSPPDGAIAVEGTTIPVRVEATDDIAVSRVDFLRDGQIVGSDSLFPYELQMAIPAGPPRDIKLEAVAFDGAGNQKTSSPVFVNVIDDQPPEVTLVSPQDGSFVLQGETIPVVVESTDDVQIQRVEILVNGVLVSTETSEPFAAPIVVPTPAGALSDVAISAANGGPLTIAVKVFDSTGQSTTNTVVLTALATLFPWHNAAKPLDVNQSGTVEPFDALLIINYLNAGLPILVPLTAALGGGPGFLDPSQNNEVAPFDALIILLALNAGVAGEGEAQTEAAATASSSDLRALSRPKLTGAGVSEDRDDLADVMAMLAADIAEQTLRRRRRQ